VKRLGLAALMMSVAAAAGATPTVTTVTICKEGPQHVIKCVRGAEASEIDPSFAGAAIVILLGSLAVLRDRRRKADSAST